MGCSDSKQNLIIEIAYCGSCGWSMVAKKLCDNIQQRLPRAVIDCRPENSYTGTIEATIIVEKRERKRVFKGGKD